MAKREKGRQDFGLICTWERQTERTHLLTIKKRHGRVGGAGTVIKSGNATSVDGEGSFIYEEPWMGRMKRGQKKENALREAMTTKSENLSVTVKKTGARFQSVYMH